MRREISGLGLVSSFLFRIFPDKAITKRPADTRFVVVVALSETSSPLSRARNGPRRRAQARW